MAARPSSFDKLRMRMVGLALHFAFLVLSLSPAFALCAMADKKGEDCSVAGVSAILIFRPSTRSGGPR
jgi:hypothetical protein